MLVRQIFRLLAVSLACMAVLSACGPDSFGDRRDMRALPKGTPRVRLDVDWMSRFGLRPTGMTVMLAGDNDRRSITTNDVDGVDLQIPSGKYRTLVYNQSPDEFGSLDFYDTDNYDSLHVILTPITTETSRAWDDGMKYLGAPEPFAVARDTIDVPEAKYGDSTVYRYLEEPEPVMTTLSVNVRVKGLKFASTLEANITGMADGYYPSQGRSGNGECNMLLDKWKFYKDKEHPDDGVARASIITFGLPYYKSDLEKRDSTDTWVTLHFKLIDGKTDVTLKYPVGRDFKYVTNDAGHIDYTTQVTLDLDLSIHYVPELPPVEPSDDNTSSGFDARVDDWENGGDMDIIM